MDLWHASAQCPKCGSYFTNATGAVNVATAAVAAEAAPVVGIEGAAALWARRPDFWERALWVTSPSELVEESDGVTFGVQKNTF
jgi:hypothetical protein